MSEFLIYQFVVSFVPAWAIALAAFLNVILFLIRNRSYVIIHHKSINTLRAASMFLWAVFYLVISVDNNLYGTFPTMRHQALVRFAIWWELNINLIYNVWVVYKTRELHGDT